MNEPALPDPFAKLAAALGQKRQSRSHLTAFGNCAFDLSKVTVIRPYSTDLKIMQIWIGDKVMEVEGQEAQALLAYLKTLNQKETPCSE